LGIPKALAYGRFAGTLSITGNKASGSVAANAGSPASAMVANEPPGFRVESVNRLANEPPTREPGRWFARAECVPPHGTRMSRLLRGLLCYCGIGW